LLFTIHQQQFLLESCWDQGNDNFIDIEAQPQILRPQSSRATRVRHVLLCKIYAAKGKIVQPKPVYLESSTCVTAPRLQAAGTGMKAWNAL
jgi:hypothetical protein